MIHAYINHLHRGEVTSEVCVYMYMYIEVYNVHVYIHVHVPVWASVWTFSFDVVYRGC